MSVAQRRRISTLIMSRSARSVIARATGATVAVSRLWPGRADRLIIAPPFVITRGQIDEMMGLIRSCLDAAHADIKARGWL